MQRYFNIEGSITDLCAKYDITSHSTLQSWILIKYIKLKLKHLYVMQSGTIYDSIQKASLKINLTVKIH